MRVTSKGQVTIPKPIRDRLGIEAGSEVAFIETGDGVVRLVRKEEPAKDPQDFRDWLETVRGTIDTNGMDGEEFVDWLRGPYEDLDPH